MFKTWKDEDERLIRLCGDTFEAHFLVSADSAICRHSESSPMLTDTQLRRWKACICPITDQFHSLFITLSEPSWCYCSCVAREADESTKQCFRLGHSAGLLDCETAILLYQTSFADDQAIQSTNFEEASRVRECYEVLRPRRPRQKPNRMSHPSMARKKPH